MLMIFLVELVIFKKGGVNCGTKFSSWIDMFPTDLLKHPESLRRSPELSLNFSMTYCMEINVLCIL